MELTREDRARIIETVQKAGLERSLEHPSFNEIDFLMGALAVFQGAGWWDQQPMWIFKLMGGDSVVAAGQETIAPVALNREKTREFLQKTAKREFLYKDKQNPLMIDIHLQRALNLILTDPWARNVYEEAQYVLGEEISPEEKDNAHL